MDKTQDSVEDDDENPLRDSGDESDEGEVSLIIGDVKPTVQFSVQVRRKIR